MTISDRIMQMKGGGFSEQEIIMKLQEEGITPAAINNALAQSKIKEIAERETESETYEPGAFSSIQKNQEIYAPSPGAQGYYPQGQENYAPSTQEYYPQEQRMREYPPQEQGMQEYSPQEGYAEESAGSGTDVVMEIAEHVFEEKIRNISKHIDDLREFSTLAGAKLVGFEERIKKIEGIIDALQIRILEKIGSYGYGLESIKKEMTMMQDSFTKMLPEIVKENSAKTESAKIKIPSKSLKESKNLPKKTAKKKFD